MIDHMITGSKLWDSAGGPVGKTAGFHCRGAQAHSLVRELKSHMLLGVAKKKKKKKARRELTFLMGVHSHPCVCTCCVLLCAPQPSQVKVLIPRTSNVTLFGDGVIADVMS